MTAIEQAVEAYEAAYCSHLQALGTAVSPTDRHAAHLAGLTAALTAEQSRVPPDRERLAQIAEKSADWFEHNAVLSPSFWAPTLREAAALLRQPMVAEWRSIEKAKLSKGDREQVEKEIKRADAGWEIWLEEAQQASVEEERETQCTMMAISNAFNDLSNALTNIVRSADGLPPLQPVKPAPPSTEEPGA